MVSLSTRVGTEEHRAHMTASVRDHADVAQTAERLTCNQQVAGSTPAVGSRPRGEVPKRPKGADCKSAGVSLRRFESSPLHRNRRSSRSPSEPRHGSGVYRDRESASGASGTASVRQIRERAGEPLQVSPSEERVPDRRSATCGGSSGGRASAFQAECRGFESRSPLFKSLRSERGETGCDTRSRCAQVAQSAEHVLGKDEVGGSIPLLGFRCARSTRRENGGA